MQSHHYKNLIFTKHGLQRMQERSITMDHVAQVINYPAKKFSQGKDTSKFIRSLNDRKHHVVAQWKEAEKKWLIISVWVRGENDRESIGTVLLLAPFRLIWWILKKSFTR